MIYASGGTDGAEVGAGRGSLAGADREPPLLADDPAGGVDCFVGAGSLLLVGAVADLVELGVELEADGLLVALLCLS